MEARECLISKVQAERLKFEDMSATYLMPDIAGESAGSYSNIQWAFRQLRRKHRVDHTGATSGVCLRRDAVTLTFESQHLPTSPPLFYVVF